MRTILTTLLALTALSSVASAQDTTIEICYSGELARERVSLSGRSDESTREALELTDCEIIEVEDSYEAFYSWLAILEAEEKLGLLRAYSQTLY
jgi:hypothetical protein